MSFRPRYLPGALKSPTKALIRISKDLRDSSCQEACLVHRCCNRGYSADHARHTVCSAFGNVQDLEMGTVDLSVSSCSGVGTVQKIDGF